MVSFAEIVSSPKPYHYENGLLDDDYIIKFNDLPEQFYDNSIVTNETIPRYKVYTIEFNYPVDLLSFYLKSSNIHAPLIKFYFEDVEEGITLESNFDESEFYKDLNLKDIIKIELTQTSTSATNIYEVDFFGNYEIDDIEEPEDTEPPQNISNIEHVVTNSSVNFSYDLPIDDDFSHLMIYRDMNLVVENHVLNTFYDSGLESDKEYFYTFKSVDTSGNISSGNTIGIKTTDENDLTPPSVPKGLKANLGNSSLYLSWHANTENDLAGYNIYVNGEKYNISPIIGNTYTLTNLNNAMDYEIQISAIDTSNNESEKSNIVTATPSVDEIPIIGMKYGLEDVAKATSNWFGSLWLLLAFSVSIPLAFYISNRVKTLFLA